MVIYLKSALNSEVGMQNLTSQENSSHYVSY